MPTSNTQQQSAAAEAEQIVDGLETSKEAQESEELDATAVGDIVTTASDEGSEEKEDLKESEVRNLIFACNGNRACDVLCVLFLLSSWRNAF